MGVHYAFHPAASCQEERFRVLTRELASELAYRFLPPAVGVRLVDRQWTAWRRYRPSTRNRRDSNQGSANRPSAFLQIDFAAPVAGPMALGHLSHFGLGLFAPVR